MKKIAQIYVVLGFLFGCGDMAYVRFEEPQPQGKKALKSFDKKLHGSFASYSDSSATLIINSSLILERFEIIFKSHINDLDIAIDSNATDVDTLDYMIKKLEELNYQIEIIGDTIIGRSTLIDTVFEISNTQILKKVKGSYFLNYQEGENYWRVNRIDIKEDTIFIGHISPSDTLLQFDFVTKNEEIAEDSSITKEYVINPTRREFKKLMKRNSFENASCYYRK